MDPEENEEPETLEEYDFSDGLRGKYVDRLASGQNTGETLTTNNHDKNSC